MKRIQVLLVIFNAIFINSTQSQFNQHGSFQNFQPTDANRNHYYKLPPIHPGTYLPYQSLPELQTVRRSSNNYNPRITKQVNGIKTNKKYWKTGGPRSSSNANIDTNIVDENRTPPVSSPHHYKISGINPRRQSRRDALANKKQQRVPNPENVYRIRGQSKPVFQDQRGRYQRRNRQDNQKQEDHYNYHYNPESYHQNVILVSETTTSVPPAVVTTSQAPFDVSDIKVPTNFLRTEYMISFTFLGVVYGLGFLVMFQSLCVPAAKIAVVSTYYVLHRLGKVPHFTIQDAMEQMPPQK